MQQKGVAVGRSDEPTIRIGGRRLPVVTLIGLVLAVAAWILIVAFTEPFGRLWGTGQDARSYWAPSLDAMYANADWTSPSAYPYSPVFLQVLQPIRVLPWQAFMAVWTALLLGALAYLTGPRLLAFGVVFGAMELAGGNIELLLGAAIVLGFRWPATWSFVLLTKITPGVGLLWFVVRREWHALLVAAGATVAIAAVSALLDPRDWLAWPGVLASIAGRDGTWAAVPVPFIVRAPIGIALVAWGARTERRWTVPVAGMICLPALWYGGFSMLLATLPLLPARTWVELRDRLLSPFARGRRRAAARANPIADRG
jgi:hypothetical protein